MRRLLVLCALVFVCGVGCRGKRVEEPPPPAPKTRQAITPANVKRDVEAAQQKHEDQIDKEFERAKEQQ